MLMCGDSHIGIRLSAVPYRLECLHCRCYFDGLSLQSGRLSRCKFPLLIAFAGWL